MAATYDPSLPSEKDHVRFLIGDTDEANALLSDEEIGAIIAEQSSPTRAARYDAAAECLSALLSRFSSSSKGVMERQVGKLRLRKGMGDDILQAMKSQIGDFRSRADAERMTRPKLFRVL